MMASLVDAVPIYAKMPSCLIYLRSVGGTGTSFHDLSSYNRTLTTAGSTVNTTSPKRFNPGSISFPGAVTNYISAPGSADWILGTNWIGQAWAYNTANPFLSINALQLFSIYTDISNWMAICLNGTNYFALRTRNAGSDALIYNSAISPLTTSTWHHFVFGQTDSTHGFLYIDGASVGLPYGAGVSMGFSGLNASPLKMGVYEYNSNYTNGNLDELALWSANKSPVIPTAASLINLPLRRRLIV
jgi:hypothetical protein